MIDLLMLYFYIETNQTIASLNCWFNNDDYDIFGMAFTFREYLTVGTHTEHQFGMPTLSTLYITRDTTTFCRKITQ